MERVVKDPREIRRLQRMVNSGQATIIVPALESRRVVAPANNDQVQGTYVVRNKGDLRTVADYWGVPVGTGRGRPPIDRLRKVIEAAGSKLDAKGYAATTEAPERRYRVTTLTKSGRKILPQSAIVTAEDVRKNAGNANKRGRLPDDLIIKTAILLKGWTDMLPDSTNVEKV
jgi:hypothetical protein